jgi:large subunit ribosomal protein L10
MRAEKKYLITEVETHLRKSDYVILTNFAKLTVADVADLRKKLDVEKAEFHVVKNSSLRVAAKALGLPEFEGALVGPTAVIVGGKNSAGVAKILKQYFADKQKLEVKVGVLDRKLFSAADLAKIADLPPFAVLRSQLLGMLTQNAGAFVRLLDAKVKKDQPAAPVA